MEIWKDENLKIMEIKYERVNLEIKYEIVKIGKLRELTIKEWKPVN